MEYWATSHLRILLSLVTMHSKTPASMHMQSVYKRHMCMFKKKSNPQTSWKYSVSSRIPGRRDYFSIVFLPHRLLQKCTIAEVYNFSLWYSQILQSSGLPSEKPRVLGGQRREVRMGSFDKHVKGVNLHTGSSFFRMKSTLTPQLYNGA